MICKLLIELEKSKKENAKNHLNSQKLRLGEFVNERLLIFISII